MKPSSKIRTQDCSSLPTALALCLSSNAVAAQLLHFSDYKMHSPFKIWEENGGASYSLNVVYLARWGEGRAAVEQGLFVFFPIFLL